MAALALTQRFLAALPRYAAIGSITCASLGLGACSDLPDERLIEYTRLLGLKATVESSQLRPITPNARRPFGEALPFETVALRAFVASPLGEVDPASLRARWIVCEQLPDTSVGSCLRTYISQKDPSVTEGIATCPDAAKNPGALDPEAPRTPPCMLSINQEPATYTVPLTVNMLLGGALEFWYIAGLREGPGLSACITTLLADESELDDNCLYGVTKLGIGPRGVLDNALSSLGIDPSELPGAESEPTPGDGKSKPAEGNRHPAISTVTYVIENGEVPVTPPRTLQPDQIIEAPLNSTLRFEIALPEAELQSYPVPVNDGEGTIVRTEEYISDWFYTWGELEVAEDKADLAVERWVLTTNPEQEQEDKLPGQMVYAYFAVRDDRGGIDWRTFQVRLTDPLPAGDGGDAESDDGDDAE